MGTTYKIHPAIGVARLGTARPNPTEQENYYLAPESEGTLPSDPKNGEPVMTFRDAEGKMLKQAARFRVYAYEDGASPGKPVAPGDGEVKAIEWTVYLANKKAAWYQFKQLTGSGMQGDKGYQKNSPELNPLRNQQVVDRQRLILDPGPRTVGGAHPSSASFDLPDGPTSDPESFKPAPIRQLGSLYAEDGGGLLVFGADGNSGTTNLRPAESGEVPKYEYAITKYSNNEGWFDDTADGPVHATLLMVNGSRVEVDTAWCLSAPPKYAPQIVNMVTLFDAIYDVAIRELNYRPAIHDGTSFITTYVVDFEREILPLIRRPDINQWVVDLKNGPAVAGHKEIAELGSDGGNGFPMHFVRQPDQVNHPKHPLMRMPRLAGDNPLTKLTQSLYLTLTETQMFLLKQWKAGKVKKTTPEREEPPAVAIDHGVLRNCVGGSFCPGIEMTWICRNKHIYSGPFRIRARKGVTQGKLDPLNGDDNLYAEGVEPGDLSKYMAQPWQADFNECSSQDDIGGENPGKDWWWWPAQRPNDVFPAATPEEYAGWTRGYRPPNAATSSFTNPNLDDMQMVVNWQHLGFVMKKGDRYLEIERQTEEIERYKDPLIPPVS